MSLHQRRRASTAFCFSKLHFEMDQSAPQRQPRGWSAFLGRHFHGQLFFRTVREGASIKQQKKTRWLHRSHQDGMALLDPVHIVVRLRYVGEPIVLVTMVGEGISSLPSPRSNTDCDWQLFGSVAGVWRRSTDGRPCPTPPTQHPPPLPKKKFNPVGRKK